MKLTAKDIADRLKVSYVVAAGLAAYLERVGLAKVVEKRFHSSGKGKPTRVYEVDRLTTINFGDEPVVSSREALLDELVNEHKPVPPELMDALVKGVAMNAAEKLEKMGSDAKIVVVAAEDHPKCEESKPDHVAAALARLKAAQEDVDAA